MRKLSLLAGVTLLMLAPPALAQGKGQGQGHGGQGHAVDHGGGKGKGGGGNNGGNGAKAKGRDTPPIARDRRAPDRKNVRVAGDDRPGRNLSKGRDADTRRSGDHKPGWAGGGTDNKGQGPAVSAQRRSDARARVHSDADRARRPLHLVESGRYRWAPGFLPGCPPGLAKKDNGCLPPGQARKLAHAGDRFNWYRYDPWYQDALRNDWRYSDGYAYRVDPRGSVSSFMPLVGGALFPDRIWPMNYSSYAVDPYVTRYYGYGDYDYRYANGTLFAVDPRSNEIQGIAALLAGDPWAVGSRMPLGYSAYNVPLAYRDRYYDTPTDWYRYSDGYVYRVDPTTQLVGQVIQLLT